MKIESLVIEHYDNGNVFIKGQKNSKGQWEGLWELFYSNGNISRRITFKEGKKDGIEKWFDKQGNITETSHWKNGQLIS
jgi:antitoxin component YwqK of YwqJK toxin-antitoxin module